ncbi:hypothetical protein ABPG72_013545 [Tetrahymena utriculariae]
MSQSTRRLQIKLEEQEKQQNLILNDVILNEQNCQIVAEFFSKFNRFQTIELKGNNITPTGFAIICKALQGNQNLKELHLEWNQIGQDSQEGLQALLNLLDYCSNITHIDLKNNNINSDGAYIISKILEVNKNLLSLDLKWNDIGVKGAEMILDGLEKNTLIKSLDISCNKVPEEMIAEVNRILNRNRSGNFANMNVPRPPRQPQRQDKNEPIRIQENFNTQPLKNSMNISAAQERQNTSVQSVNVYPQEGQENSQYFQSRQQQDKKQSMNQIEKMLQNEKKRVNDMKERIEQELQEEQRVRQQFEVNLLKLRDSVLQKEGVISGLELDFNNLVNENNYLRNDLEKVKADLSVLQDKYSQAIEGLQEHISNNNKVVATLERDQIEAVTILVQDQQRNMTDMIREWSSRYNSLDEKYISLKSINEDLKDKINIIREQMLKIRLDGDDQKRSLKIKIQDDVQRKYEIPIKNVENAYRVVQEQREEILRKNQEIVKDINYKEQKYDSAILNLEKEIAEQRQQLNTIHNKLSVRNMKIESHKTKHVQKDDQIQDLEEELLEAQRALQRLKDDNKEKQEYVIFQHNNEKKLFKESQELLHQRVLELERAIRNQDQQNSRLKTEYEKLCHVVQSNIQRSVVDTLAHEQNVLHVPHIIHNNPPIVYQVPPKQVVYTQHVPINQISNPNYPQM